jgi:hypothetical protein
MSLQSASGSSLGIAPRSGGSIVSGESGCNGSSATVFEIRERVSIANGERMIRSAGFVSLRQTNEPMWSAIFDTFKLASALGGYVPVRYYMHEAQEGHGRLRAEVMVRGMRPVPYVRMKKEARAALAADLYWDVDMANCQPRLLAQKLAQYGIECKSLQRYIHRKPTKMAHLAVTNSESPLSL